MPQNTSSTNNKKRTNYPKINPSPKRSMGSMKGGFDKALLHLGVTITEPQLDAVEE